MQDVRTRAADCLGKVTQFSPRVDPIINDLCKGVEAAPSPAVMESTVEALQSVLRSSGARVTPPVMARSVELLQVSVVSSVVWRTATVTSSDCASARRTRVGLRCGECVVRKCCFSHCAVPLVFGC